MGVSCQLFGVPMDIAKGNLSREMSVTFPKWTVRDVKRSFTTVNGEVPRLTAYIFG